MRLQDYEVREAASKLGLSQAERLVLYVLNSYGEEIFPKADTVAKDTGFTKQYYRRVRNGLVEKGILTWKQRWNASTVIHLNYSYLKELAENPEVPSMETTGSPPRKLEVPPMETTGSTNTNNNTNNNSNENSNNTDAMESRGIDQDDSGEPSNSTPEELSTGEQSDPWMDSLVASNQPGANTKEALGEPGVSTDRRLWTDEQKQAYIDSMDSEPIAHTGWLAHRGIK